ncbi:long-chain acyl-CoA synthetase [Friedmanniella endophytica]|uniref:Acyl-CoA synthetase n=1 Tax=Microlunatus kandeliicorticis TaxID=1759536 RepID=A0A7W3IVM8_9ACTN|nr:long-chain fatty acid--CoA ligase [Microlunatus kandeliicorticis]MBA8796106.1 long-chain acyl-CoA synthetase [Microlunatus kandeliicorticis]
MDKAAERIAARPSSVGEMFASQVERSGPREAFRYRDGDRWVSLSWSETRDRVYAIAGGLLALGLEREDRVAIASGTRIEWVLADLAIMCAGAATTTVYPNTQHADVAYILRDSRSRVIITEDADQTAKVLRHLDELDGILAVVQIDGTPPAGADGQQAPVISWAELADRGRRHLEEHPEAVADRIAGVRSDTLSTLIYTSGTTGKPKGVRLLHDSWSYEAAAIDEMNILSAEDVQYLWLPLSHVFGKLLIAIQLRIGFSTAVDGNIDQIVDNLAVVKPTFMAGAPRIFEKVKARVTLQASKGVRGRIFGWAFGVGARSVPIRREGRPLTGALAAQYALADRLVFSKIKERMGGRIRFFVSGSAALSREVQEWFYAAGLTVIEGYGLTETSAATFVNDPYRPRFGTVGPPVPGTEVKIGPDGEIWVRGPGVMDGYHELPEATAETLVDGWFATGDVGELDADHYLTITDRKKDLIKTSGGKYVAPQKVEGAFKAVCPYVSNVIVHGEGRKYVTALITLDPEAIVEWGEQNGLGGRSAEDLARTEQVHALIDGYVNQANGQLERWETIKRFAILPQDLTVEEGEVTPSMKVKRKSVESKYADVLDGLYDKD